MVQFPDPSLIHCWEWPCRRSCRSHLSCSGRLHDELVERNGHDRVSLTAESFRVIEPRTIHDVTIKPTCLVLGIRQRLPTHNLP